MKYKVLAVFLITQLPLTAYGVEEAFIPEIIRQDQRFNELKKQITDQSPQLTQQPKQSQYYHLKDLVIAEQPCFLIHHIGLHVSNNDDQRYSAKDFNGLIKILSDSKDGIIGRCIGTQSLKNILNFTQNEVIKRGMITSQITALPQDLNHGRLELQLELGRIHKIVKKDNQIKSAEIYTGLPLKERDLLQVQELDQGLDNFKKNTNRNVDIQVLPASDENKKNLIGYSDLLIHSEPLKKLNFNIGLDDSGTESTGKYIGNIGIAVNSPFYLNDAFNINLSHSLDDLQKNKNKNLFISYQVPFKNYELMLSFNGSDYEQYVAGYNAPILYSGKTQQTNATLSRLLSRGQSYKTNLYLKMYHRRTQNFIENIEVGVQRRETAGWNIGLQHRQYIGSAIFDLNLNYRRGTGALHAKAAPEEQIYDIYGNLLPSEGYARAPLWSADIRLNYPFQILNHPVQYRLNWKGQLAPKILVPQDRFYIGGRYSVRGFDENILLSGDRGHSLQQEFVMNSPLPNTQFYFGLDQGWVGGRNSIPRSKYLLGSVTGLRSYYKGVYVDAFAGRGLIAPYYFEKKWVTGFSINFSY